MGAFLSAPFLSTTELPPSTASPLDQFTSDVMLQSPGDRNAFDSSFATNTPSGCAALIQLGTFSSTFVAILVGEVTGRDGIDV